MKAYSLLKTTALLAAIIAAQSAHAQDEILLGPPNGNIDFVGDWFSGGSGDSFVSVVEEGGFIEGTGRINIGASSASGNADFRSQAFPLTLASGGEQPLTIEFYIKFTEPVAAEDSILMQLRYFLEDATSWVGEENIGINADTPGIDTQLVDEWQMFRMENITATEPAVYADIRTSVNIFSDWSSGEAQFDAIRVTTPMPDLQTPVAISHLIAQEVDFFGETGKRYRIQSRTGNEDWIDASEIIVGNDENVSRTFQNENEDRVYRVVTD